MWEPGDTHEAHLHQSGGHSRQSGGSHWGWSWGLEGFLGCGSFNFLLMGKAYVQPFCRELSLLWDTAVAGGPLPLRWRVYCFLARL